MQTKQQQKFNTTDLGLASVLFAKGFDLIDVDKTNRARVSFAFADDKDDDLEQVVNGYWTDKVDVKAKTLIESTKTLKNMIYS